MVSHRPALEISFESIANHPRYRRLTSRNQYRSCHIRIPDSDERLAAIVVENHYYSFFRLVKDRTKAMQLAAKLVYRGDQVVLTPTVKGDAVWIYEADASELRKELSAGTNRELNLKLWRILDSEQAYQSCQICVPEVAKPLRAIYVENQYYSFLRMMRHEAQAIELAQRLTKKGRATRIVRDVENFSVWVLESEATIIL